MKRAPIIHKVNLLYSSRLFTLQSLEIEFSNGEEVVFERVVANAPRAVMVAAISEQNEILLVREWAAGTERYELQLPKGIVEPDETSEQAAVRELVEETGYAANQVIKLQTLRVSPGYFQHDTDVVWVTDLFEQPREGGDEPEPLEVVAWPMDRIDDLLALEEFSESRSIAALLLVTRALARKGSSDSR